MSTGLTESALQKQEISAKKRKDVNTENQEESSKRRKLTEMNQYVVLLHLEHGDTWYRKLLELSYIMEGLMTCTTCKQVFFCSFLTF